MPTCYANEDAQFQPAMRLVNAITNAYPAAVTTTFDHGYTDGLKVRFYVPPWYGMPQMDKQVGTVTVTGNTTFTVDIDTRQFDAFALAAPAWYQNKCALVIPVTGTVQDVT